MTVMRLIAFFIFTTLLTGCNQVPSDDLAQAVQEVKAAKAQPPCSPPGQHSENSCLYRLQITQVIGNGQYKGKVRDKDIQEQDADCAKPGNSPNPKQCPSGGNNGEQGPFTIDSPPPDLKKDIVVQCKSDPTNDHLKNCKIVS